MKYALIVLLATLPFLAQAKNETNQSFSKAKKMLEREVYNEHRETFYCAATFSSKKIVTPPTGFTSVKYVKRSKKIEWEHVVAAENFGRNFVEWRDGVSACKSKSGKKFSGRKCAEKTNIEYRYMQADMFNLVPAIGSVNALRSNYNFIAENNVQSSFGSCDMKISKKKAVPPESSRGRIARTHLYMDSTYSKFKMSNQQRQLMTAWDKMYPVSKWECERTKKIMKLQGGNNLIIEQSCKEKNIW